MRKTSKILILSLTASGIYNIYVEQDLETLEGLSLKNYPFAFALFPDELMAGQLLVDAVGRMVRSIESVEEIHSSSSDILFLKHMAAIALLRDQHFSHHNNEDFYKLSLRERMVLFLKEKRGFSLSDVAKICDQRTDEVYRVLSTAKEALV